MDFENTTVLLIILVKLQTHVNQAFHKGKRVGVFIDIEKAYDMGLVSKIIS